jgi:hypothetical protein
MKPHTLFKLAILLVSCFGVAQAQDDILQSYSSGTIPGMINAFTAKTKSNADHVSVEESYLIRTRATYRGSSRKVSSNKSKFLAKWLKENKYPEAMLPREEFLFREGETDHWLIMQNIVAQHFVAEIKAGAAVDLYLVLMGSVKEDGNRSFVILINEFKRPEDERPSGPRTGQPQGWDTGDVLRGYERYVPRTIKEIITRHSSSESLSKANVMMTGDTFPSRVTVTHTGESRKTPPEKMQHLEMLIETFKVSPEVVKKYETELLFREGSEEYWLPVQGGLLPYFQKELTKGETVIIYAEWVGARKVDGKWIWIFIVNEFQKVKTPTITTGS